MKDAPSPLKRIRYSLRCKNMKKDGNEIRIGKVSSINYEKGMMRVTYPDRDDAVTAEIPVLSFTDEYKMPQIGDEVMVSHFSNGSAAGIVMGRYWNKKNTPRDGKKDVYRKEFDKEQGKAYLDYDYNTGEITIHAKKIKFVIDEDVTVEAKNVAFNVKESITSTADIIVPSKDVVAQGKSLAHHTHTAPSGETSPPN